MKDFRPGPPKLTIDRHPGGQVKACPVISWAAPAVTGPNVFLKLAWATAPQHLATGDQQMQLILTQSQALQLAQQLQQQVVEILEASGPRTLH